MQNGYTRSSERRLAALAAELARRPRDELLAAVRAHAGGSPSCHVVSDTEAPTLSRS
jgi:hypothetical protein